MCKLIILEDKEVILHGNGGITVRSITDESEIRLSPEDMEVLKTEFEKISSKVTKGTCSG